MTMVYNCMICGTPQINEGVCAYCFKAMPGTVRTKTYTDGYEDGLRYAINLLKDRIANREGGEIKMNKGEIKMNKGWIIPKEDGSTEIKEITDPPKIELSKEKLANLPPTLDERGYPIKKSPKEK